MSEEPVVYEGTVLDEWIDYNGHMNEACYVRVFSESIDGLMDHLGIDAAFRARENVSIYTLQTVVHYLKELRAGEPLAVTARVLEYDSRKVRVFLTMCDPLRLHRFATMEALLLHVDMASRRSGAFRAATLDAIDALHAARRHAPWPACAGEGIALRRERRPAASPGDMSGSTPPNSMENAAAGRRGAPSERPESDVSESR
ncbi:thioesterase family protein [Burkholderia anthina]|uniref:thioesterase family protein n=2 Tax=Burkholderiaceae TaxID=119060 RepID=UPI001AA07B4F|nr:thioesterase family protein [Burkholderia anthina]QTD93293.1 thioesterase family protein [Burkholderia anthina]